MRKQTLANLGLFSATVSWGMSFFLVKGASAEIGVWPFLFWRFTLAFLAIVILFPKKIKSSSKPIIKKGMFLGILLFLALWTQTQGLQFTSAGRSGFITSLYVPLTPLIAWILFRRTIGWRNLLVVCVAVIGLYILTLHGAPSGSLVSWWAQINTGDAWTLATAFFSALHIIIVEKTTREESDSLTLGLWQFFWCLICILSVLVIKAFEGTSISTATSWSPSNWSYFVAFSVFFNALVTTDFGFIMQIICQKTVGALKAALIFALEAPLATLFAYLFMREVMTTREIWGAALVFLASAVPERWLEKTGETHGSF